MSTHTTYSYTSYDAAGFEIARENLTLDEVRTHWANLIVSGYIIHVTNDTTGEIVPESHLECDCTEHELAEGHQAGCWASRQSICHNAR